MVDDDTYRGRSRSHQQAYWKSSLVALSHEEKYKPAFEVSVHRRNFAGVRNIEQGIGRESSRGESQPGERYRRKCKPHRAQSQEGRKEGRKDVT